MVLWIQPRLDLRGLLAERGHPTLEVLDAVLGGHAVLRLHVGLGVELAEPQSGHRGLKAKRELRQSHGVGRRRPPQGRERDAGYGQAERRVDKIRSQVDAPPFRPDQREHAHLNGAVVVR